MNQCTIWMGDIDPWMDEVFVKNIFLSIAPVKSIKVMKKNGQSIGYGFIEFDSEEVANYVLTNYNGKPIMGSNKLLKLSKAQFNLNKKLEEEIQIYICDMDSSVNEEQLRDFFSKDYSSVFGAKVICDPYTRISKGYGFVKFKNQEEANRAVTEMNGKSLNGKRIRVK